MRSQNAYCLAFIIFLVFIPVSRAAGIKTQKLCEADNIADRLEQNPITHQ